ncbi:MAG: S8 family serine peptidase [Bacteroidota bacterium]
MKKESTSILVLLLLLLHTTVLGQGVSNSSDPPQQIVPHTLVFKVDLNNAGRGNQGLNPMDLPFATRGIKPLNNRERSAGRGGKTSLLDGIYTVQLAKGESVLERCAELKKYGNVLYAEPIYREQLFYVPSDPAADPDGGLQPYLAPVKAYEAWDVTQGSEDIVVGVIDTGADMDHEDLTGKFYVNQAEIINGIDDDGNGYVDDRIGYDFANSDNDPQADRSNHGTKVGGLAAADTDNGVGMAGLGFDAQLMPLKAFTSESNLSFGTYEAIRYAADNGVQVLNLSWGSINSYSQFNQDIINYAVLERDVVIVAAAGNNNQDVEFYPASYDNVLSIAATDNSDSKASFSTYSNKVDLAAPGSSIYSTSNTIPSTSNDVYANDGGTSYASPIVAGIAALVRSQFPDLNARQVMERIRVSADDIYSINSSPLLAGKLGKGRVNAFTAVSDTTLKAARVVDFSAYGRSGDAIYYGDSIFVDLTLENFLDTLANLQVKLVTYNDELVMESLEVGTMQTFEKKSFTRIKGIVSDNVTPGSIVDIRIEFEDTDYTDFQQFSVQIAPDYLDFESGSMALTLSGNGELARVESGTTGVGLQVDAARIAEQVGLLFTTAHNQVADNAPTMLGGSGKNLDFEVEEYIRPYYNSIADTYSENVFDDRGELGLRVEQSTMAWDAVDSALILDYRVVNTSGSQFASLSTGLLWNWDLKDMTRNRATWDGSKTAYTFAGDSTLYAGVRVIGTGTVRHSALDIDTHEGNSLDAAVLTDSLKHHYLAIANINDAGASGGGNDVAQVIGLTLDPLEANESTDVAYLVAVAGNLDQLNAKLDQLEGLYQDFQSSPPVAETFFSCEGAFADIAPSDGTTFNFYSDAFGSNLIGTGATISIGPTLGDTTIYVAQADNDYEGAILSAPVLFIEEVADFEMDKDVLYLGGGTNIVTFTDNSFEAETWAWTFGNGDAATVQNPKLVYSKAGTYTIELTVQTSKGCSGSTSKVLEVMDRPATLGIDKVETCYGEDVVIEGTGNDGLRVYASAQDSTYVYDGTTVLLEGVTADTTLFISNVIDGFESAVESISVEISDVVPSYQMIPALDSLDSDYLWLINTSQGSTSLTWTLNGALVSTADTLAIKSEAGSYQLEMVMMNDIGCAGTLSKQFTVEQSDNVQYEQPSVICTNDQVVIDPENGSYFGFYSDAALTQALHKGKEMHIDSIQEPITIYITGLDKGLKGEALAVSLEPNTLPFSIVPEQDELFLDRARNVRFSVDTVLYQSHWFIDGEFYNATSDPIVNFGEEGTYLIKVEGTDIEGCPYEDSLSYQVWARTPLVLNVAPDADMSLSVYPNPSSDYIHLMTEQLVSHLAVFDLRGQLLMQKTIPNAQAGRRAHGLAIHELPLGTYLLQVRFNNGNIESQRFIKH